MAATKSTKPINCPWMLYHMISRVGNIFHGWQNYELYRKESLQLLQHIEKLKSVINKQSVLYIAIGAAAEEITTDVNYNKYNQYQQLFPHYIESVAKQNIPVNVIIISPNESFEKGTLYYKDPKFIDATHKDFKKMWHKIEDGVYYNDNINVNIFCTPMMCEDMKKNKMVLQYARGLSELTEDDRFIKEINDMEQTSHDIEFITTFYKSFGELLDIVEKFGGVTICNSYAVFTDGSESAKYRNYYMFPKIMEFFVGKYPQRILSEWSYTMSCTNTVMCIGKTQNHTAKITYTDYIKSVTSVATLIIHDDGNKLNVFLLGYNPKCSILDTIHIKTSLMKKMSIYHDIECKDKIKKKLELHEYLHNLYLDLGSIINVYGMKYIKM